jgi:hypothetical protein
MSKQTKPALVVFGRKGPKLPHAARFDLSDARVAQWVAEQHRLSLVRVDAEMMRKGLGALPTWGLNKDGQPLIPVVTLETLDLLQALKAEAVATGGVGPVDTSPDAATGSEPTETAQREIQDAAHTLWGTLKVDTLVIAPEDNAGDGWWEAVILAVHDDTCTLCWRDYPEHGLFKRKRDQLALLRPAPNSNADQPAAQEERP